MDCCSGSPPCGPSAPNPSECPEQPRPISSYGAQTWEDDDVLFSPPDLSLLHVELFTVELVAGDYILTVGDGDELTREPGNRVALVFLLPETAGITITVKNSTGDTLHVVEPDDTGDTYRVDLYHNGTSWQLLGRQYPVN